jgi:2-dehydropantoate 2-reductase
MRILVFGAGPLGSLFAARLHQGGQQVTLLARGQRLAELHQNGIVLRSWTTGKEESVQVPLIERLEPDDFYDLILVIMRKNLALKALPDLAANRSPQMLFLMNNAAGPQVLLDALGKERVLIGFPGAAGYREGNKIVHINAEQDSPAIIYMGEPDGGITCRLEKIQAGLSQGLYLKAEIETNMDAWLKYHVALLFPSLATGLYLCGNDNYRMARTRDALVLAWRGMKEGFRVLKKLGYPVRPPALKPYTWMPEPVAVAFLRKLLRNPRMEVAMVRHATAIRDEIGQLNSEFLQLVDQSALFTPNIRFLIEQFEKQAPAFPDGSRTIRLRWGGILIPALLLVYLILGLRLLL